MSAAATGIRASFAKKMILGGAAMALAAGATGCSAVEDFNKSTSDSWAVTYEVSVTGGDTSKITDIKYLESEKRGEAGTELSLPSGKTTAEGKDTAVWSLESIVTAEKDAAISAVPDNQGAGHEPRGVGEQMVADPGLDQLEGFGAGEAEPIHHGVHAMRGQAPQFVGVLH